MSDSNDRISNSQLDHDKHGLPNANESSPTSNMDNGGAENLIYIIEKKGFLYKEGVEDVQPTEWITAVTGPVRLLAALGVVSGIIFASLGIWLVTISSAQAESNLNIFGQEINTNSVGVACIAIGAICVIITIRRLASILDNIIFYSGKQR